uniref:CCHC-type domain-containing protein n=1 Tax=Cannabis sativa TaxID=3483 RepID=A0A803Q8C8_CANSA
MVNPREATQDDTVQANGPPEVITVDDNDQSNGTPEVNAPELNHQPPQSNEVIMEESINEAEERLVVSPVCNNPEKTNEDIEVLRSNFLESMTLELEPDFELTAEVVDTGVLASFFGGKGVSKSRLREILSQIWKLKGYWKFKTLKPGVWGIFFEKPEDRMAILRNRPWIINGKLLILREWPEDGDWFNVNMGKATFWVMASGLPTPYLNGVNSRTIAAKAGKFVGSDLADNRTVVRRGFLKFQVEIDTSHQLTSGFFLDVKRGRREWIQFRYFKLPKLCYNCGYLGHDKKECFRSTAFAYPPQGEAVPAYGPWMKAETAIYSCFNTRNQLDFFREGLRVSSTPATATPADDPRSKAKGKRPVQDLREQVLNQTASFKPTKKVIRVNNNGPGSVLGKNLKVVKDTCAYPTDKASKHQAFVSLRSKQLEKGRRARSISPSVLRRPIQGNNSTPSDIDILNKFSSRPPPNPADNGILTTIMANIGPTYDQMVEKAHVELCQSRQPHKHPEPTHFPWPIYADEIGLAEELMGPAPIDKFEPTPTLFHDPIDVSDLIHQCPQPRKRKASLTLIPYVQHTAENTMDFSQEIPPMAEFSPAPNSTFKMGSGPSSSSTKNDKRRRKGSRSKATIAKKNQNTNNNADCENNAQRNLIDTLNLAISAWVNRHKVDCVFLMETKVTKYAMEVLARKLGFNNIKCSGAKGLAGGSCLMWNNNINLVVNYFDEGFFEATVWDFHTRLNWKFYAVYGTPYVGAKEAFWRSMEIEFSNCQLPWVLIGDLNCICNYEEKDGGRKVSSHDTKWLNSFLEETGGVDLHFIGNKFTWQNNRFSGGLIRERLDRAICSPDWLLEYTSAGIRNMPISISDHAPIILDTHLFASRGFIPFRFFEAWTWEESCKQEVASAWSISNGNNTASFIKNIHKARVALQAWKKKYKTVSEGDIKDLENRLQWLQNQPISELFKEEEARIQSQIRISWSKLESMWRQKSRETWLSLGDKNTRFFHASTIIRRRRNSIWSIKDKEGRVWKDKKHIAEVINNHFQELYTSSSPNINEDLASLFSYRIDALSNEQLVAIPSDEEIKASVFNLHPLKAPGPDGFFGCFYRKYWDVVGPNLCIMVKEFFASVQRRNRILGNLNIDQVNGEERHLGNPFVFSRRKKENYARLKESLMKKLEGWKMKLLSYAGRLTLIKNVTSAIPIYAMSTSKIPLSSCRELDSLMRKYWWLGKVDKDRYLALKAWDQICQPKISGGLGLRRCEDMNRALLAKLAWSLATHEDRPWVNCLLKKYCVHENFWCVKKKNNDSFQWKCILESRDIINKGTISIAASGFSISFWDQPWIPWLEFHEFKELMSGIRGRGYTIKSLGDISHQNKWNDEIIKQVFGTELGNRICNIPRIPAPFTDQIYWKNNQKGNFTVKDAYQVDNVHRFAPSKRIWKWIWEEGVLPRNSVMLWRVLNEAIPTKNRLHFLQDKTCSLCDYDLENASHLFFNCNFARAIWFGGLFPVRVDGIVSESLITLLETIVDIYQGNSRVDILNYLGCTLSEIWHQRNAYCIRDAAINIDLVLGRIRKSFFEVQQAGANSIGHKVTDQVADGSEALQNSIDEQERQCCNIIFTDASWTNINAGIASMDIDTFSGIWFVKAQKVQALSVSEAELLAIQLALTRAIEKGWQKVHILSDSKVAVQALSKPFRVPDWRVANVFYSVVNLSKQFLVCLFFFINRSFNVVADGAAKNVRTNSELAVLYQGEGNPPVIPIYFN